MVKDRRDPGLAPRKSAAIAGTTETATRAPTRNALNMEGPFFVDEEKRSGSGSSEPTLEPRRPEPCRFRMLGNKRTLIERSAEVARRPVG